MNTSKILADSTEVKTAASRLVPPRKKDAISDPGQFDDQDDDEFDSIDDDDLKSLDEYDFDDDDDL